MKGEGWIRKKYSEVKKDLIKRLLCSSYFMRNATKQGMKNYLKGSLNKKP